MFSRIDNGAKLAMVALCRHFAGHGGALIDCQMQNDFLATLGVPGVAKAALSDHPGHPDPATVARGMLATEENQPMSEEVILKVGLTPRHPCSYLGHEQEQLLVLMDHELLNAAGYERLLTAGFRRSGNDIYRPHCPACSACQSLRIHSERFTPSRGQKRIRQLNRISNSY